MTLNSRIILFIAIGLILIGGLAFALFYFFSQTGTFVQSPGTTGSITPPHGTSSPVTGASCYRISYPESPAPVNTLADCQRFSEWMEYCPAGVTLGSSKCDYNTSLTFFWVSGQCILENDQVVNNLTYPDCVKKYASAPRWKYHCAAGFECYENPDIFVLPGTATTGVSVPAAVTPQVSTDPQFIGPPEQVMSPKVICTDSSGSKSAIYINAEEKRRRSFERICTRNGGTITQEKL